MPFPRSLRLRFTLRTLLLATTLVCVLFSWRMWSRQQTKHADALRQRQQFVGSVMAMAHRHEAVRNHKLLREYHLRVGTDSWTSQTRSRQYSVTTSLCCTSSSHRRPEWPVEELKKALLSSLVEAVLDMKVFSSVDITTVTPDCAVIVGDEGCIVWETTGIKREGQTSNGSPMHSLRLEFACRGCFRMDAPSGPIPKLYKLGVDPELALQSEDPNERLAAASFVAIQVSYTSANAFLKAIRTEKDPRVKSRLFQSLEVDSRWLADDSSSHVLSWLRSLLESDDPDAPLAAATILRGECLFNLFNTQRVQWNTTAQGHIRRACIELLQNGRAEDWGRAVQELRRHMLPDDTEAVEAILAAIGKGGPNTRADGLFVETLRGDPYAIERSFAILSDSDQPEVWYAAASILEASAIHVDMQGQRVSDRVRSLSGKGKRRMQVVGSYSRDYEDELKAMGSNAFEFLAPLVNYRVWENAPSLYTRACDMLAKLGDRRAVPLLAQAVEDHFRHGNLDSSETGDGAVHAVKAINELTGKDIGGLGTGTTVSEKRVDDCDWPTIRQTLAAEFRKP